MSHKIILPEDIKKKIVELYIDQNKSKEEVAKALNLTMHTLSKNLSILGIRKSSESIASLRKETNLEKYGVDNPSKLENVKAIIGEKNHLNKETRVAKQKDTKRALYGDPNYNNMEQNKLTKKLRYNGDGNYNNRDKYKESMMAEYGVDNGFKLPVVKNINKENIFVEKGYTNTFYEVFNDREKALALLKTGNLSYFDLAKLFNAPYYVVQMWATRLDVKDYIKHTFEGKSTYENEIVELLQSFGVNNIIRNSKNYLDGQEIDIYLPDYKIGIEFNGTFWHSDLYKENDYHFKKSKLAESKGIRLIHIYEYEWLDADKKKKICSLLRIALGKAERIIYARNCSIKKITDKEASILNNANHLQNHRKAHITYGLFYKDELVQLMSFSKNKKYEWEIIRGCPASNNIVVGGVSKLFKHFVKEYNPKEIFSYCDFNKFDGHGYEQLGMHFIGYTGPDMKYIIKGKVVNRQPSKYKELKSQVEARIYGAGSKKYLWRRNEI